jgi:DHA2 family multidrug resistance protein
MATGSGFVNLSRQLGGSIGIAAFSTLLTRRLDFHRISLDQYASLTNHNASVWLANAQMLLIQHGYSHPQAQMGALGELSAVIAHQAAMLAFNDAYFVLSIAFLSMLPLLCLFRRGTASSMSADGLGHG